MDRAREVLKNMTAFAKYAQYDVDKGRRETVEEIFDRYQGMMEKKYPSLKMEIDNAMREVHTGRVVPSMRALQFSGKAVEKNNARLYNCGYIPITDVDSFAELMFLLLSGTGIGYSVQQRHISKLNPVTAPQNWTMHIIDDSIEGWALAVRALIESYLSLDTVPYPIFSYDSIRPEGTPLKTAGGYAPGPEPLKETLQNIEKILDNSLEKQLSSVDVFDIACWIAMSVYSGGIRRAATIALFDRDDELMLDAKKGTWLQDNQQRRMANISAVLPREHTTESEFCRVYDRLERSGSGEPGFFWTNDVDMGCNPCAEISLEPYSFCNLTEVNVGDCKTEEDFMLSCDAASFLGTLQAGFTDFPFLSDRWKEQTEKDALIGVSLTGLASYETFPFDLTKAVEQIKNTNVIFSEWININPAKRLTTIKPSGTASMFLGTSAGIGPFHAPFYERRVFLKKTEPLIKYLEEHNPEILEDSAYDADDRVVVIPLKAPDNAITAERAITFLDRIKHFHSEWIQAGHVSGRNTNNISATVDMKPDEWPSVYAWLWINRDKYNGLTLLPTSDTSFPQLVFTEISEDEYNNRLALVKDLPFEIPEMSPFIDHRTNVACSGGSCEVKFL